MIPAYRPFLCLVLLFAAVKLPAQDITGSWEGVMHGSGGTFLQVNIQQQGYDLCGFTYDYVMSNPESFCRARLEGKYDYDKNLGLMVGTGFLQNSGTHVLMRIKLWRQQGDNSNTLHAARINDDLFSAYLSGQEDEDVFVIKRVSSSPKKFPTMLPCFPKQVVRPNASTPNKLSPVIPKKEPVKIPVKKIPVVKPVTKPVAAKPTIKRVTTPVAKPVQQPVVKSPVKAPVVLPTKIPAQIKPAETNSAILRQMNARKKSEQSRVVVNTNHINLKLYDNGTVDNDTVSVFYNGRLLVSHQRLSEKAIEINIDLDEGKDIHEITMYAENLGSIPPNTALVIVTAGKKRYELRSKANMEENAVLVFEYKPEE